jgi:hypothetical protein
MYELDIDTINNRIVYLDNKDYEKLIIEDFVSGQKMSVDPKVKCESVFLWYCIDSVALNKDKVFVKWKEIDEKGNTKRKVTDISKIEM